MLLCNELCQVERIISLFLCSKNQCFTIEVGHTDILQGCIERNRGNTEDTLRICHHGIGKDIGRMAIKVITDTLMAQHHTLRTTR